MPRVFYGSDREILEFVGEPLDVAGFDIAEVAPRLLVLAGDPVREVGDSVGGRAFAESAGRIADEEVVDGGVVEVHGLGLLLGLFCVDR